MQVYVTHSLAPTLSSVEVFTSTKHAASIPAASARLLSHSDLPEAWDAALAPALGPLTAANGTRAMLIRTAAEDWAILSGVLLAFVCVCVFVRAGQDAVSLLSNTWEGKGTAAHGEASPTQPLLQLICNVNPVCAGS